MYSNYNRPSQKSIQRAQTIITDQKTIIQIKKSFIF